VVELVLEEKIPKAETRVGALRVSALVEAGAPVELKGRHGRIASRNSRTFPD